MSSPQRPLLDAHHDPEDPVRLRREIAGLERQLEEAKQEVVTAKQHARNAVQAIHALRQQLEPLHQALKMIFGEISRVDVGGQPTGSPSSSNAKWESWKQRLPGRTAEIIDLLLVHEQMNTKQLSGALRADPRTVAQYIHKLNNAGILTKNGGMFSLKQF